MRKFGYVLLALMLVFAGVAAAQGGTIGGGGTAAVCCSAANGTAAAPTYSFVNSIGLGLYRFGADTLGLATGGVHSLRVSGGAIVTLAGGAGNMTILSGTGASRALILRTTSSGSAAQTVLTLTGTRQAVFYDGSATAPSVSGEGSNNDGLWFDSGGNTVHTTTAGTSRLSVSSTNITSTLEFLGPAQAVSSPTYSFSGSTNSGMYVVTASTPDTVGLASAGVAFAKGLSDTLIINSKAKAPALTAASGTPNSVCIDATSKQLLENAALTCTVSARRFKRDIAPLSSDEATRVVMSLKPSTFTMISGGRKSFGLIAEDVDAVDTRLTFRDAKGVINSVDYQAIGPILVRLVQDQQRQIAALEARVLRLEKRR